MNRKCDKSINKQGNDNHNIPLLGSLLPIFFDSNARFLFEEAPNCHHTRAITYFTESIRQSCTMLAVACPSYQEFINVSLSSASLSQLLPLCLHPYFTLSLTHFLSPSFILRFSDFLPPYFLFSFTSFFDSLLLLHFNASFVCVSCFPFPPLTPLLPPPG